MSVWEWPIADFLDALADRGLLPQAGTRTMKCERCSIIVGTKGNNRRVCGGCALERQRQNWRDYDRRVKGDRAARVRREMPRCADCDVVLASPIAERCRKHARAHRSAYDVARGVARRAA